MCLLHIILFLMIHKELARRQDASTFFLAICVFLEKYIFPLKNANYKQADNNFSQIDDA